MNGKEIGALGFGGILLLGFIALGMWGCPSYSVWQQKMQGQAELQRAEENRKITIEEARAALESAKMLSDAEVERARGVKEANDIIAEGLGGPEGYLRYLWIQALRDESNTVIYIPTEANLPILEAVRKAK